MDRACDMARGMLRSFMIARSHYENIDQVTMSQGFAPVYTDAKLDDIEKDMPPLAYALSAKIEDDIIPPRG